MTTIDLLNELKVQGLTIEVRGDKLRLTPRDRVTPEVVERVRMHKDELLAALTVAGHRHGLLREDPLPLDLLADSIAACARSPILDDLALAHAARAIVAARRVLQDLAGNAHWEGVNMASRAFTNATASIRRGRYLAAFEILENLPARLSEFRLQ